MTQNESAEITPVIQWNAHLGKRTACMTTEALERRETANISAFVTFVQQPFNPTSIGEGSFTLASFACPLGSPVELSSH